MVEHMDIFLEDFFDEYNSKPYQEYAVEPIVTLAALTNSAEVGMRFKSTRADYGYDCSAK